MIKPTIGRVVWYKDPQLSDQFCKADIVYVHSDSLVNIAGYNYIGTSFARASVELFQGPAEECPDYHCCWMPYQQKAAEKEGATK